MKIKSNGTVWAIVALMGFIVAGCVTPPDSDIEAASTADVQYQAWGEVKDLTASLERLDLDRNPGIAALVRDLQTMIAEVEGLGSPDFEKVDPEVLLRKNPNYWRAMLEMSPTDPTLLVLEGMVLGAAGRVEDASDTLEIVRAGPLVEEELDKKLVLQRRTIERWRWNPPIIDLAAAQSLPADQRWEPVKRIQQFHPDSATAAMAVLKMRSDLAEIDLTPDSADQRMRDKILKAEPAAVETLQKNQPLQAALITATGEAGDAARRIAEMITPDTIGILNFSDEDLDKLVADLNRIGATAWALRISRLQIAQRGGHNTSDIEIWRQLLPEIVGEKAANAMISDWENGRMSGAQIYRTLPEPTGTVDQPMDSTVAGHYERRRRDAVLIMEEDTLPTENERLNALIIQIESAIQLGRLAEAERALGEFALASKEPLPVAQQRLSLALARGDTVAAEAAKAEVMRLDRRLTNSNFLVGNAEIMAGNWRAAADAFERGFKNTMANAERRGFSALHAYGAARLANEVRSDLLRKALEVVPEDAWIANLLQGALGEMDREQLLAAAEEGRDYIITGQRCEAYFALAFAPGQTVAGRRTDLTACRDTGMIGYIEYEFARHWLNH
ncbi:MAG: hypothetical protein SynsKO_42020 [Synoicihabitans sp.]